MRRLPRLLPPAVAAGLMLAGCSTGADEAALEELRTELAARETADATVTERVDALEEEVAALRTLAAADDVDARLDALDEELQRLVDALTVLESDLDAETAARIETTEELRTETSDLRAAVDGVRATADAAAGEVDQLRTLYETLRDRLDRLQRGS